MGAIGPWLSAQRFWVGSQRICGLIHSTNIPAMALSRRIQAGNPGIPTTVFWLRGAIDAPDSENLCGWLDLDDVIDALANGDTYVNVHTLQSLSGEIRGQLK